MSILKKILEEIEKVANEHPYKVPGKPETYGSYNEAWQDCSDRIRGIITGMMEDEKSSDDGWIPVEEGLPEESLDSVIGWDANRERCCFVQYYMGRWILGNGDEPVKIIAWRPVPTPYKPKEYGLYLQGRRKRRKKR